MGPAHRLPRAGALAGKRAGGGQCLAAAIRQSGAARHRPERARRRAGRSRPARATGLDPDRLDLEITESVFLNDEPVTDAMFASLKRIGVRLALDDFGTGYSALGYLRNAPFDKIKIDQSFVRGACVAGSRNGAIIASIVSLAEALGMETTAEGVETLDELDMIRQLGCSHIQGYIYAQPLCVADVAARLGQGLSMIADPPISPRAPRQILHRPVTIEHEGTRYSGTIRNISERGAMLDGLWNVPVGLELEVDLTPTPTPPAPLRAPNLTAIVRWSHEGRIGVEFTCLLELGAPPLATLLAEEEADDERSLPQRRLG